MGWGSAVKQRPTRTARGVNLPSNRPHFPPADIDWKRLVTIDFETYFDQDYTLKKLTTSQYVRDPRFEAQMMGIKIGLGETDVVHGSKIRSVLRKIDWSKYSVLAHHCVPGETEVLTRDGWKRIDRAGEREEIMQWDPDTGHLSWCTPLRKIVTQTRELLRWNTSFHRGAYTPEHRMYYQTPDISDWRVATARDISMRSMNGVYVPVAGVYESAQQIEVTPDEARLMEAIRADGSWAQSADWSTCYGVQFNLRKHRKIERLQQLCAAAGVGLIGPCQHGRYRINACPLTTKLHKLLGGGKSYKSWIVELPLAARHAILEELFFWDGSDKGCEAGFGWSTADALTAQAVELLAHTSGWSISGTWRGNARGHSAHLPDAILYTATLRRRSRVKLVEKPIREKRLRNVYCYTVPTGAFMIRAGGRVCITGNCQFDGLILNHHFGVIPRFYYCTLSMARGWLANDIGASLDEVSKHFGRGGKLEGGKALGEMRGIRLKDMHTDVYNRGALYCGQDVEETHAIFKDHLLPHFPQSELDLIDATVQMFTCPVLRLDEKRAKTEMDREIKAREDLLDSVAGDDVTVDSLDNEALRELTGAPAAKGSFMERKAYYDELRTRITLTQARQYVARKTIGSSEQFAALLRAEGVEPPIKISPTWIKASEEERATKEKYTYAFAKDDLAFQELAEHESERVRALQETRLAVKSNITVTRAGRLLESGRGGRPMPVYYKYAGAATWRFSGGDGQNWQNFTRGGELRLSIEAPAGHVLCVQDSGQIEARVNAWLWEEDELVEAFRSGEDIYSLFATENIYGYNISKDNPETKKERHVGKVAILGLGYGMGPPKFRSTLARGAGGPAVFIDEKMSFSIVNAYRRRFSRIKEGWAICDRVLEDMAAGRQGEYKCLRWEKETVWLPNGMRLKYPNLRRNRDDDWVYDRKGNTVKVYGAMLNENLCQALARIIVAAEQLLKISERYPVVMTTHDEVVTCVPKAEAKQVLKFMNSVMVTPPDWCSDIPLAAEGGWAFNYSK